jgi:hypothetical protein
LIDDDNLDYDEEDEDEEMPSGEDHHRPRPMRKAQQQRQGASPEARVIMHVDMVRLQHRTPLSLSRSLIGLHAAETNHGLPHCRIVSSLRWRYDRTRCSPASPWWSHTPTRPTAPRPWPRLPTRRGNTVRTYLTPLRVLQGRELALLWSLPTFLSPRGVERHDGGPGSRALPRSGGRALRF